jgi:1-acyl-sn-glycerol-3-phosphate acyltransferase
MIMNKWYVIWLWVRSIWTYFLMAIFGITFFLPALVLAVLLPERHRYTSNILFGCMSIIYRLALWVMMVKVRIEGQGNLPKGPCIIIGNHESAIDIPLLGILIGSRHHIWYAYHIFFHLPVVGIFLRKISIPVYLNEPTRSARSMVRGICLARTYSLSSLLFPEGGRHIDGKIHDFFAGFAMIARKLEQPVVPVIIRNAGKVYPPHSFLFYPHVITVEVGVPLYMREQETNAQFANRAREWFVEHNL